MWYAFTEWQWMILGYFIGSFSCIFSIIQDHLLHLWKLDHFVAPILGPINWPKAIDRDRSADDILDLLLEVPRCHGCHGHGCHDCHDERQAIVELLGYEAVLEGFAVVLCSVYSVPQCTQYGKKGAPFSRRCLMSFVLCYSIDILWIFYRYSMDIL